MWPWLSRTSTAERVGEGSSSRAQLLAGFDQRKGLGGVDAERLEHLGREDLAHAALERQPPVAEAASKASVPSPWCPSQASARRNRASARTGNRARRRSPGCKRGTDGRDNEARAASADYRPAARNRPKCADPRLVAQSAQAYIRRPAIVAETQNLLRKARRLHRIAENVDDRVDRAFWAIARGLRQEGHAAIWSRVQRRGNHGGI